MTFQLEGLGECDGIEPQVLASYGELMGPARDYIGKRISISLSLFVFMVPVTGIEPVPPHERRMKCGTLPLGYTGMVPSAST